MMWDLSILLMLVQCVPLSSATPFWNNGMVFPRGGGGGGTEKAAAADVLPEQQHMPSLFGPEESEYDHYAAALAATEALRRIRDKAMSLTSTGKQKHGAQGGGGGGGGTATEDQKRIRAEYLVNSSKVLKAMGMSVSQFNQLSREVNENEELKEKVSRILCVKLLNCMCIRSKLLSYITVGIFR